MIDGEDPTTSEVISAMLTWYYSHNQNLTLSSVGVTQVKVNGENIVLLIVCFSLQYSFHMYLI